MIFVNVMAPVDGSSGGSGSSVGVAKGISQDSGQMTLPTIAVGPQGDKMEGVAGSAEVPEHPRNIRNIRVGVAQKFP